MVSKKILVLGSGMVAKPCVDYLLRDPRNSVTIGMVFRLSSLRFEPRPVCGGYIADRPSVPYDI